MPHHVELWVPDLGRAVASWGWLLRSLAYVDFQHWPGYYAAYLENEDAFEVELVAR